MADINCQFQIRQGQYVILHDPTHRLFRAVRYGDIDEAGAAIASGADVNAHGHLDCTPLHVAAEYGHEFVARMLIDHGADVNASDCCDSTPLHCATSRGFSSLARLLIEHGADVHAKERLFRQTPLDIARAQLHEQMALFRFMEAGLPHNGSHANQVENQRASTGRRERQR